MKLTENETKLIDSIRTSSETTGENEKWVDEAFEDVDMDPKTGRGVLSSLVKKGLVTVGDNDGRGRSQDMYVTLTETGKSIGTKVITSAKWTNCDGTTTIEMTR